MGKNDHRNIGMNIHLYAPARAINKIKPRFVIKARLVKIKLV